MLWAVSCVVALLAVLASRVLWKRIWYTCAPLALNMLKGPSSRARDRSSRSAALEAHDGWRTLELWKSAEQSRSLCGSPSNPADGSTLESTSNIGLPQSVAISKSDFRLAFTRGHAAVLVGLFQNEDGEIRVILTKRAQALSSHSGTLSA
ncbi:hypothetical protein L7F22_008298 [Adiantum nelumboides]|nr:hypothetical protein [Adiantum nelumboides]